jgi:FAD/FMN-containing dehydrogenase
VPAQIAALRERFGGTLAHGNGRSYGDSCLAASGHVIRTTAMDRFVAAEWARGRVIVEAGLTLGQLLTVCVPRGWFLPVLPGTQFVTAGGAVANDIHGKNHHLRGTFGRHVEAFGLLRSDRDALRCAEDENRDLFRATIGGLGITGVITWIELRLMPIGGNAIEVTNRRFASLAEFFALSHALDASHEYAVAWIDCLARGGASGRGVYTIGKHAAAQIAPRSHGRLRVPMTPPVSLAGGLSLRAFNAVYYRAHAATRRSTLRHYEPFFFPLDRLLEWNRLYGPAGFQQFQCVLPEADATLSSRELLGAVAASGRGSFLAVMKRCGTAESPGLMSFPLPGVSIALDFPQHPELASRVFPRLDAIVRAAGGRLYPAKDAHMSGADFRAQYPSWERVEALRDPALDSRFWQRVTRS